jgi:hypothetical protein
VAEANGMMVLEGGVFAFDIAEEAGRDLDETVELALVVDPAVGKLLVAPGERNRVLVPTHLATELAMPRPLPAEIGRSLTDDLVSDPRFVQQRVSRLGNHAARQSGLKTMK